LIDPQPRGAPDGTTPAPLNQATTTASPRPEATEPSATRHSRAFPTGPSTKPARALRDSDYQDSFPVGTLAAEVAVTHDALREAGQAVFAGSQRRVAARLRELGVPARDARRLACFAVAVLEGATLLGRVDRTTAPLADTERVVADTLRHAVG
jgi:hypothetical protein